MKNLRVYIDKDRHDLYEKLVKRGSDNPENYPFQTMKDVFMLAACLGLRHDAFLPVEASKDIFNSDVFDEKTDLPIMAAIAFHKDQQLSVVNDDKRVLEITQGYANGGIAYVEEQLLNNPGKPLTNLVSLITNDEQQ